jgi:hypothetical protein
MMPRTETKITAQANIGDKTRSVKAQLSSAPSCLCHNVFDL